MAGKRRNDGTLVKVMRQRTYKKRTSFSKTGSSFKLPSKMPELKEFVTYGANFAFGSPAGIIVQLNNIVAGTDYNQRIGRHMYMKSIDINLLLNPAVTSNTEFSLFALVHDRQTNGIAPIFSDIYDISIVTNGALAFKNTRRFTDRFTILWEERSVTQGATGNYENTYWRKHIPIRTELKEVEYENATASLPAHGALYLVAINTSVAGTPPTISYGSKLTFYDP